MKPLKIYEEDGNELEIQVPEAACNFSIDGVLLWYDIVFYDEAERISQSIPPNCSLTNMHPLFKEILKAYGIK